MSYKYFINAVEIGKKIIDLYLKEGQIALDCTVGNGHDTLLLANIVGETGKVYGFDIQSKAIDITRKKLLNARLENRVSLINDGHENIDRYISGKIDFVIYNLGYLPNGDKSIITKADTTIESIKKSLNLLSSNGIALITCYTGHKGGREEQSAIKNFLTSLNQKKYNVLEFSFINQKHNPPILYGVEKI